MTHIWLTIDRADLETELLQCEQEGRDTAGLADEFRRLAGCDLDQPENQLAAQLLLDAAQAIPVRPGHRFAEPSDLSSIRDARPQAGSLPPRTPDARRLPDQLAGAWTGRCAGCLLGKPVEGWRRDRMWPLLKEAGRWPLNDYFRLGDYPESLRAKFSVNSEGCFADRVDGMPEDDDTNYTTAALAIFRRHGPVFTPQNVADFWLNEIPLLRTCTAERVAYRNLAMSVAPPDSAAFRNPYREWIGAQIRADFWGYCSPGDPARAAEFAWRDACISHVKNGIYGAMWSAAMTAAAFVETEPRAVIEAGLAQIPARSRLADAIESVVEWHDVEVDYDTAVYRIHELWNESRAHDWCHTISNAMVVATALMWGDKDFGTTVCRAVQACFDTDCNGATAGSIIGAMQGLSSLDAKWTGPLNDTLHTGVSGYHTVRISAMAGQTAALIAAGGTA